MNKNKTLANEKRKLQRKLKSMGRQHPFMAGSLTKIHRRCGNPKCRCAQEDASKHPAHLLTTKIKGKTHAVYVPVDMVEEVRQWCRRYRELKDEIKSVSECCEQIIRLHTRDKRERSRTMRRATSS